MTAEYQTPLFADYPITVQFDRRRAQIAPYIHQLREKYSLAELLGEIFARLEIYKLELLPDLASFSEVPDGICEGNRECFCYTSRIPFLGDRELWTLAPSLNPEPAIPEPLQIEKCLMEGEIYRQELIIATLSADRSFGTRVLEERVAQISSLIQKQNHLISQFHVQLWDEIARQVEHPRGKSGRPRHH